MAFAQPLITRRLTDYKQPNSVASRIRRRRLALLVDVIEACRRGRDPVRILDLGGTEDYWRYVEWMHYAEGSAMFPLLLALMAGFLGDGAAMLQPRIDSEIANNLSYIEQGLQGRKFFVGDDLTGADIQLLFVLEAAGARLEPYPTSAAYRDRMHARPAYKRALERGGPYQLMGR